LLLALTAGIDRLEGAVGGHFGQSSAVQAVVRWFGQSDLVASGSRTEVEARLLPFALEAGCWMSRTSSARPDPGTELVVLVSAGVPPFLIAHGDRDHIVLPSEGLALHHALVRGGARSRFELLGGAGHEGARFDQPTSLALTAAWLRARLCESARPGRVAATVGDQPDRAVRGELVITAAVIGDVRQVSRFPNRDHFAACNGTAPIEVSSGRRKVYRLSRRGYRRFNHAIRMVAVTQIRYRHTNPGSAVEVAR
jgi:transposase IS116/IS110/IS902 family protein/BD-FAE protein